MSTGTPEMVTPQSMYRHPCFSCGEICPAVCFRLAQFELQGDRAAKRAWDTRWHRGAPAEVSHPLYGSVVVPHPSKLAALENAAELWGIHWTDIRDARVIRAPASTPVQTPWNQKKTDPA